MNGTEDRHPESDLPRVRNSPRARMTDLRWTGVHVSWIFLITCLSVSLISIANTANDEIRLPICFSSPARGTTAGRANFPCKMQPTLTILRYA